MTLRAMANRASGRNILEMTAVLTNSMTLAETYAAIATPRVPSQWRRRKSDHKASGMERATCPQHHQAMVMRVDARARSADSSMRSPTIHVRVSTKEQTENLSLPTQLRSELEKPARRSRGRAGRSSRPHEIAGKSVVSEFPARRYTRLPAGAQCDDHLTGTSQCLVRVRLVRRVNASNYTYIGRCSRIC